MDTSSTEMNLVQDELDRLALEDATPLPPYHPSFPFEQRITRAISRYRKKTSLTGTTFDIFRLYCKHGNISIDPRPFIKKPRPGDYDIDDYAPAAENEGGVSMIKYWGDPEWELLVDFELATRRFLSEYWVLESPFINMDAHILGGKVIRTFLEWLKKCQVCPEYEEEMDRAIRVCRQAEVELPLLKRLAMGVPGSYDRTYEIYIPEGRWYDCFAKVEEENGKASASSGGAWGNLTLEEAERYAGITKTVAEKLFGELSKDIDTPLEFVGGPRKLSLQLEGILDNTVTAMVLTESDDYGYEVEPLSESGIAERIRFKVDQDVVDACLVGIRMTGMFRKVSNDLYSVQSVVHFLPTYYLDETKEDDQDEDVA